VNVANSSHANAHFLEINPTNAHVRAIGDEYDDTMVSVCAISEDSSPCWEKEECE